MPGSHTRHDIDQVETYVAPDSKLNKWMGTNRLVLAQSRLKKPSTRAPT